MSQMKSIAAGNAGIKRMYTEVSMQNDLLKDALKKAVCSCGCKELAKQMVGEAGSIRLACATFRISETCCRYEFSPERRERGDWCLAFMFDGAEQAMGLRSMLFASTSGALTGTMRGVSHLGAEVVLAHQAVLPPEASEPGQVDGSRTSEPLIWSSDFTIDQTKDGLTMRVLCVLDDRTRVSLHGD